MYYVDRAAKLKIDLVPGYQKLNGEEALEYLRFRHDAKGDIGRGGKAARGLLWHLLNVVKQPVILSKIPKLVKELSNYVHTNLGIHNIIILAKRLRI